MNGVPAFSTSGQYNQGYNQGNNHNNNDHHGHGHGHGHHGHHGHHHGHQEQNHGFNNNNNNYNQQQQYVVQDFSVPGMHVTVTSSSNQNPYVQQAVYQEPQNFHPNGHHQQQVIFNGGLAGFVDNSSNNNGGSYYNHNLPHMVKRSNKIGRDHHHGSQHFDQYFTSNLHKEFHRPEAESITVFHTHNLIVGIEVHYKTLGNNNVATLSSRGYHSGHVQSSHIKLNFGEYFTEISGRAGDSIDRICIKTSGGRCLEVGGNGGNTFGNILPWGHPHIHGFGGSTREFLDSFYVLHS